MNIDTDTNPPPQPSLPLSSLSPPVTSCEHPVFPVFELVLYTVNYVCTCNEVLSDTSPPFLRGRYFSSNWTSRGPSDFFINFFHRSQMSTIIVNYEKKPARGIALWVCRARPPILPLFFWETSPALALFRGPAPAFGMAFSVGRPSPPALPQPLRFLCGGQGATLGLALPFLGHLLCGHNKSSDPFLALLLRFERAPALGLSHPRPSPCRQVELSRLQDTESELGT